MKKLILIALALTLAMGIIWMPSVAAVEPVPITIHKTIPASGPPEAFTFEAWRDVNNNGIIDFVEPFPDFLVGQVVIVGAGTGVINSAIKGPVIIHEVLIPGSAYQQLPDQIVQVSCPVEVAFDNELGELGELIIKKVDGAGNALAGATFVITPDPKTGAGSLTVVDNGLNDEDPADGVLLVTGCLVCIPVTVTETVPPPGYTVAPPQPAHVTAAGETVELTFIDTLIPPSCGTVCAAQTAPGEYFFGDDQNNWFTWIYYYKGWGTEAVPYEYPIYTGKTTLCGTLYVYDDGDHIFVNYVLTDTDTCTLAGLSEYHLQVNESFNDLKKRIVNKGGNPVPGKCTYKGTLDPMQPETGWIECTKDDISDWSDPIYIFAHGVGCYYCA